MKQKRGQFFILAAVIIISLLVGIFIYSNEVFIRDYPTGIESLKKEVGGETGIVIDYGLYHGEDKLSEFIGKMTENLLDRGSPDLIFFYGNETSLNILNLGNSTLLLNLSGVRHVCPGIKEEVTTTIGLGQTHLGIPIRLDELSKEGLICSIPKENRDEVKFSVQGAEYNIPLIGGKRFYFVIREEVDNEIFVATG